MVMGIWQLDIQLTVQSVPKVVSLNLARGKVSSIQHYAIKSVSELQQVVTFSSVLHQ